MQNNIEVNKTTGEYRKNFYKMYHRTIAPIFKKYEKERKTDLLTLIAFVSIGIFLAIISYQNMRITDEYGAYGIGNIISFILFIGSLVAILFLPPYFYNKFIQKLKNECMPQILKVFGNVTWFEKVHLIEDIELSKSDLFSQYNRRATDDSFWGEYNGVKFKISETHMELETGSGKNRRVVNIFRGVVVKFEANKIIRNKTIVASRWDDKIKNSSFSISVFAIAILQCLIPIFEHGFSVVNLIYSGIIILVAVIIYVSVKIYQKKNNQEVLEEIKLEDPEFTKKYKAYSSDQVEGRYLITPAFMERFKNIQTAFGTNKVKCSFYDDSLMFAISTNKNLFEIGNLFYNLENPKQLEVFFNELISIFVLIDYFKLDEKTGL